MAEEIIKEEVAAPVKVEFTKFQEAEMFKSLAHKTYKAVGYDYGVHLMYPGNDIKVTGFVHKIADKIRRAPELWGISPDTVEVIQEALDSRSIKNNPKVSSDLALQEESFRDKLDTMRDTVAEIITRKLKKYNTVKGAENVQLRDLKDLLSMAIDKSRLLRGESTENITKMAKIDVDNLKPEDAMAVIMKARELMLDSRK